MCAACALALKRFKSVKSWKLDYHLLFRKTSTREGRSRSRLSSVNWAWSRGCPEGKISTRTAEHNMHPCAKKPFSSPEAGYDFLSMRRVYVSCQPIGFVRFDKKSVNLGLPVFDQPWGRESWCWPKGVRPLGTKMLWKRKAAFLRTTKKVIS